MNSSEISAQEAVYHILSIPLTISSRSTVFINTNRPENRISMHQLALGYCLHQPMIDKVLIGVDNLNQLNQNITDAQGSLPNGVIEAINEITVENVDLLNPSLWR